MRPKGTAQELERRRRRAVALLKKGHCQIEVAGMVGSSKSSVTRWKEMAQEGPDALDAKPHPGRKRRLSDKDHRKLEKLLAKGAKTHGFPNDLWTAGRVRDVIEKHFGVDYHEEHARHILKKRLGWSSQKPELRARQRDEKEIERWKRREVPRIKKRGRGKGRAPRLSR